MSHTSPQAALPRSPISVVVCAFGALEYTRLLLDSLEKHSRFDNEIVVYSDGSTDGTAQWLSSRPDIVGRHDPVNRGICTAMNRAAELATREYLFFPNTDHVVGPGWDEALFRRLGAGRVVSATCIEPGLVPVAPVFHTLNLGTNAGEFDREGFTKACVRLARPIESPGVNYPFALSRRLWREVGGLDERFNPGPANDPDLFYRLHLAGARLIRAHDVLLYHFSGKSSRLAGEVARACDAWHEATLRNERAFEEKWGERYRFANGGLPDPGPEARRRAASEAGCGSVVSVEEALSVSVDARCIRRERDGISAYAVNLLQALSRRRESVRLSVLTDDAQALRQRLGEGVAIRIESLERATADPDEAGREVESRVAAIGARVHHGPAFIVPQRIAVPAVATIHDLTFDRFPHWYPPAFVAHMRSVVATAIRSAAALIAVSDRTHSDLIARFPDCAKRVRTIHEAVPEEIAEAASGDGAPDRPDNPRGGRPYFLCVGAQQTRKNAAGLLRALAAARREFGIQHGLVLTMAHPCEDPAFAQELSAAGMADIVWVRNAVEPSVLAALYRGATALVVPSLYEGFGLPVLEAMACGVPVVCSDGGALPEVAGGAALVVPAGDDAALARAIARLAREDDLREDLIRRGRIRVTAFSWHETAKRTLEVFREAARRPELGEVRSAEEKPPSPVPAARRARPRIAVDARLFDLPATGTGRYTQEILARFWGRSEAEFVVIGPVSAAGAASQAGARVVLHVEEGAGGLLDAAWEQFSLPSHLVGCDVLFAPSGILPVTRPCRGVAVVHDLGHLDRPEFYPPALLDHLRTWGTRSVASADRIVAVSGFTRDAIGRHFPGLTPRVRVVPHGAPSPAGESAGRPSGDILCVSAFEPNKNQEVLVAAFARLPRSLGTRLILAGRSGRTLEPLRLRAQALGIGDRVSWLPDVPDQAFADLYRRSGVFAFPSLYEGFGLPILEAMSAGIPVVVSDAGACAETAGPGSIVVPAKSEQAWAEAVLAVLQRPALADSQRRRSRARAAEFDWARAAEATWAAILEVAAP